MAVFVAVAIQELSAQAIGIEPTKDVGVPIAIFFPTFTGDLLHELLEDFGQLRRS